MVFSCILFSYDLWLNTVFDETFKQIFIELSKRNKYFNMIESGGVLSDF